MKKIALSLICLILPAAMSWAPVALACAKDVSSAEQYLARIRKKAAGTTERKERIERMLEQSAQALKAAKARCAEADSFFERSAVTAEVLGIRSKIAAADTLIKK